MDAFVDLVDLPVRPEDGLWNIEQVGYRTCLVALLRFAPDDIACVEGLLPYEGDADLQAWPHWILDVLATQRLRPAELELGSAEDFVKPPFTEGFATLLGNGGYDLLLCLTRTERNLS